MATKHTINWNLYRKKSGIKNFIQMPDIKVEDFPEIEIVLENLDFSKSLEENLLLIFEKLNIENIPKEMMEKILLAANYGMRIKVISFDTVMTNIVLDAEDEGTVINQDEYKIAFKKIEEILQVDFFDFLIFLKEYFGENYKIL